MSDFILGLIYGTGIASVIWGLIYSWDKREIRDLERRLDRLSKQIRTQP